MPTRIALLLIAPILVLVLIPAPPAEPWSPRLHVLLNRYALQNLPPSLRQSLTAHADEVVALAAAADERRSRDPDEGPRHFIDLDRYGTYPFADVPRDLRVLIQRYGPERIRSNGLLPWTLVETTERLAAQMREGNPALWRTAADLGHYAADANMPLHTTENYNGQKTGNTGAHALFEEVLIEANWRDAHFVILPAARPPADLPAYAFETVIASYARIAPLLAAQTRAQERYTRTDLRFYQSLWAEAGTTLVASMNKAAHDVAVFWLAAWEAAGRPDLR